ncbi:hypothetical protein BLS_005988 [Venturia inaequalis]|uniref:Uncharacterized protein n=1 Tax=Venturia inaequalis TaxID=5025 RepID=A0A8H3YP60_VENIN|nr:hypothetical protein BLS_005988 [Venturia inaequalis]KAE9972397.1 hypothetical protein EG328_005047 [Venturia inaequalis]KAE9980031.1 hypothetical protein EG327_006718 [Venturia inaequalis]RDI85058.1 Tyrosine--tRNA ligase [Venturia inaequalis]
MAHIKGPGMFYVNSVISRKDIMDYDTFMKWYDDDHIAEIMETSGISDAFRYIDNDAESSKPYLAFYPMPDVAFTQGEEFKKIRVKSELLPGSQMCFDLADFDARIYGLTAKVGSRDGVASTLFVTAIEPGTGSPDAEVERWFEGGLQDAVSKIPGFKRTTRYKLLYARTNAQSRALGNLPTTDEAPPEPPSWAAVHEFDREVDASSIEAVKSAGQALAILGSAKQVEFVTYRLAKAHGGKGFFDG